MKQKIYYGTTGTLLKNGAYLSEELAQALMSEINKNAPFYGECRLPANGNFDIKDPIIERIGRIDHDEVSHVIHGMERCGDNLYIIFKPYGPKATATRTVDGSWRFGYRAFHTLAPSPDDHPEGAPALAPIPDTFRLISMDVVSIPMEELERMRAGNLN